MNRLPIYIGIVLLVFVYACKKEYLHEENTVEITIKGEEVVIADPYIEFLVRLKADVRTDKIYNWQAERVHFIHAKYHEYDYNSDTYIKTILPAYSKLREDAGLPVQKITNLQGIEACKNLTYINLAYNNIQSLEPLRNLKKLGGIDISFNTSLSYSDTVYLKEIFANNNLWDFSADGINYTGALPFFTKGSVSVIFLRWNDITCFAGLCNLESILYLHLNSNKIAQIPSNISGLRNLITLSLHRNNLSSLPQNMSQLSNLQEIELGHNQFTEIPAVVKSMSSLERFAIYDNPIQDFSQLAGMRIPRVYLDNTGLSASDLHYVEQMGNLNELKLYDNPLPDDLTFLKNMADNNAFNEHARIALPHSVFTQEGGSSELTNEEIIEYLQDLGYSIDIHWK